MSRNPVSKRRFSFILLSRLALAALFVAVMARSIQANQGTPFNGTFTVQAELLTTLANCAPGDTKCIACINNSGIYLEAQGVGDTSRGTLFLEILKCFNPAGGAFGTYVGIFTMTAPNGKDSVTGTYSGQNDNAGDAYGFGPFSGELTITSGTGKFANAGGSVRFTSVAGPVTAGPSLNSLIVMAFYSVQGTLSLEDNN